MWVLSRFQSLTTLTLYSNKLTGKLPDSWGSSGAFPKLRTLTLSKNDISGAAHVWPEWMHVCCWAGVEGTAAAFV